MRHLVGFILLTGLNLHCASTQGQNPEQVSEKKKCVVEAASTGSRIGRKVCATPEEKKQQERDAQKFIEQNQ